MREYRGSKMMIKGSVYNREITRAATLALTSFMLGIVITNKKKIEKYWNAKWSSAPVPAVAVVPLASASTPVPDTTSSADSLETNPPTIYIIEGSQNPSTDRMNICKKIPNTAYIERFEMNIVKIRSRVSDNVKFEDLLRDQILYYYPTKPPIPVVEYLNNDMIIIIC